METGTGSNADHYFPMVLALLKLKCFTIRGNIYKLCRVDCSSQVSNKQRAFGLDVLKLSVIQSETTNT